MDSLRGEDSAGIIVVPNVIGGRVKTHKRAIPIYDFIDGKKYRDCLMGANKVLVGHNRWATKGGVSNETAHPFTHGDVTMVHNGTLKDQTLLPDNKDYAVDSENICHAINKQGIKDTWKQVDGAAALVWWDNSGDGTLQIIRNKERPLHYCYSLDNSKLYFASEEWMLVSALERNDVNYGEVKEFVVNTLYTFDPLDVKGVTKLTLKAHKPHVSYQQAQDYWGGHYTPALGYSKKAYMGDKVDFEVLSKAIVYGRAEFKVRDNENPSDEYYITDSQQLLALKEGDLATGKIGYWAKGKQTIQACTVVMDSEYEFKDEEKEEEKKEVIDDIPFDNGELLPLDYDEDPWELLEQGCDWCSSPIISTEDYLETTEGNLFCSNCKDSTDVREYVREA